MNPLQKLGELGQAIWLDDTHRDLVTSGRLAQLIREDGLRGMTSNPAIFQKAITASQDYDAQIRRLTADGRSAREILEALTVRDVRMAADVFRDLYEETHGDHGYVSLEVDPYLAREPGATIDAAHRLWDAVDRPNIFIKVPGTREGLAAIARLTADGINVNVTLLFSLTRYGEVAAAYARGLEDRVRRGEPISGIRSVASFFLSRIDVLVDELLDDIASRRTTGTAALAERLKGRVAIACARVAYQHYRESKNADVWKKMLHAAGASPQWLLWASTSTKNPEYSDVKYIDALSTRFPD